ASLLGQSGTVQGVDYVLREVRVLVDGRMSTTEPKVPVSVISSCAYVDVEVVRGHLHAPDVSRGNRRSAVSKPEGALGPRDDQSVDQVGDGAQLFLAVVHNRHGDEENGLILRG